MEAFFIIVTILGLIVLGWGGITLWRYVKSKYNYNFLPIGLLLGIPATILVSISIILTLRNYFDANAAVCLICGIVLYIILYYINLKKTNWWLGFLSLIYQVVINVLIILVVVLIIFYFLSKEDRRKKEKDFTKINL